MVRFVFPAGMFGANEHDSSLDTVLRDIAVAASNDPDGEWAEKYGTDFENDTFMMHRFCWCDDDDCQWCMGDEPNFRYKPSGFEVIWYKFIGRDVKTEGMPPADLLERCLASLGAGGRLRG